MSLFETPVPIMLLSRKSIMVFFKLRVLVEITIVGTKISKVVETTINATTIIILGATVMGATDETDYVTTCLATSQIGQDQRIGATSIFLFKEGKSMSKCRLKYRIGLTTSRIVSTRMRAKVVEWMVTLNMLKPAPKCMIECLGRAVWSMAKSVLEPKKKISFPIIFENEL